MLVHNTDQAYTQQLTTNYRLQIRSKHPYRRMSSFNWDR